MMDKLVIESNTDTTRLEKTFLNLRNHQNEESIKNPEVRDTSISSPIYGSLSTSRKSAYTEDENSVSGFTDYKQQDINTLMKLLNEKDKTMKVLMLVHKEKKQMNHQIESLNRELAEKKTIITNLLALLKDVSNRLDSVLKNFERPRSAMVEEAKKAEQVEGAMKRCNSSFDLQKLNESLINVAKEQILQRLQFLEFKAKNIGLNKLDLLPKVPMSPTKIPQNSKLIKLEQDKILLENLWVKAQEDKYSQAVSLQKQYAIIRSNFYSRRGEPKKCSQDQLIVLMEKIERLERRLQQYASQLQRVKSDQTRTMKSIMNTVKDMKNKHEKELKEKQMQIDSIKAQLPKKSK